MDLNQVNCYLIDSVEVVEKDVLARFEKFIQGEIKKLTAGANSAYENSQVRKMFRVDLTSIKGLMKKPSFKRLVQDARERGIPVNLLSNLGLKRAKGLTRYLRLRRLHDVIEGPDATQDDILKMQQALDVIDGKTEI